MKGHEVTKQVLCIIVVIGFVFASNSFADSIPPDLKRTATDILGNTGTTGGLIVHVGCGDGKLTAALRAKDSCLVQGLDTKASSVATARKYIKSLGLYGDVTVDRFDGKHLPYVDNLVRLLVAANLGGVPQSEVMRVLAPLGVAYVNGKKIVKPWPKEIDDWTHYLYDATNNAVSHDSVVAPLKGMQWFAGPLYARSHEYDTSISAMVSARGRIFYIQDDGPIGVTDERLPQKWSLYARDAFNGVVLWKVPVPGWGWPKWKKGFLAGKDWTTRTSERLRTPVTLTNRLVANGDRVYVTLGYNAGISILNAATGKLIRTCPGSEYTDEILYSDGVVLAVVRKKRPKAADGKSGFVKRKGYEKPESTDYLMAFDPATGKLLWRTKPDVIATMCVVIEKGRVFSQTFDKLVCNDLRTGKELWRQPNQAEYNQLFGSPQGVVVSDGKVFYLGSKLKAFATETGKQLWSVSGRSGPGRFSSSDLFVAAGKVWAGYKSQKVVEGIDPQTGKIAQTIDLKNLVNPWHHFRCYRSKATERYLLWSKQGAEFIDLKGNNNMRHDWFRGPCRYGLMPANGMLYMGPHQCICFSGVMLNGFNALTARSSAPSTAVEQPRLEKGPVFGTAAKTTANGADWPMFRADSTLSGCVKTTIPSTVSQVWQTKLKGKLSQPTVSGGRLYVSELETDTVHCLNSKDGKKLWSKTVGGRVDSPPTICGGMAIFGSADGWVYCLRATDGELAWRYLIAPADRRLVAKGRVESAWPVHGAVLLQNGIIYASAGRSTFLDGGITVCALDPGTGKLLHKAQLDGPWPDVVNDNGSGRSCNGSRTDVLVGDGNNVYLSKVMLNAQLQQQGAWGSKKLGNAQPEPHLESNTDLLDDAAFNRTFRTFGGGKGQVIVFNDSTVYSATIYSKRVGRSQTYFPAKGYIHLSASSKGKKSKRGKKRKKAKAAAKPTTPGAWDKTIPIFARGMALAGDTLLVAGKPDRVDSKDPLAALENRAGGLLWAFSASGGKKLAEYKLDAPPVFDGLIAADGCLYLSLTDGQVICLGRR